MKRNTSELQENLEEMLPWYYMDSDVISRFKSSATHWCDAVAKGLKKHVRCTVLPTCYHLFELIYFSNVIFVNVLIVIDRWRKADINTPVMERPILVN